MVTRILTGLVLLVCFANTLFAQTADTATTALRPLLDSVGADLPERLGDVSDPDQTAAQQQLRLDDLDAARSQTSAAVWSARLRSRVQLDPDLANTDEYRRHYYRGSPLKTSTALRLDSRDVELSVVEAKDPGEPLYFDHAVASVSTRRSIAFGDVRLRRFVLGSFALGYGNGLAFANGHPQFPSAQRVTDPIPRSEGIMPYRSTSSFRYFNGAAASVGIGRWSADLFFSDRSVDATIDSAAIRYISTTGYHRTTTELDRRQDARQVSAGGGVGYSLLDPGASSAEIGALGYAMHYDHTVALADTSSFKFRGDALSMISAYARANTSRFSLDAEYAASHSGTSTVSAAAVTASAHLTQAFRLSANVHMLPSNFYSPFGGTFGLRSDDAQNERGYYLGASYDISSRVRAFGYSIIAFNASLPNTSAPVARTLETRIGTSYLSATTKIDAQARYLSSSPVEHAISEIRVELDRTIGRTFELRALARVRDVRDSEAHSLGYVVGFEARCRPATAVPVSLLVEPFHTDAFASRVFSVEEDLAGLLPFVQLYGRGIRYKLVLGYEGLRWLQAEAAIGQTVFSYPIDAPTQHKTTLGLQITMSF